MERTNPQLVRRVFGATSEQQAPNRGENQLPIQTESKANQQDSNLVPNSGTSRSRNDLACRHRHQLLRGRVGIECL